MAKSAHKAKELIVDARAQADETLATIGKLETLIEKAEVEATLKAQRIREEMETSTENWRLSLDAHVKALQAWAKIDQKNWVGRTLELINGKIYFRKPNAAIKEDLEEATIFNRLIAAGMEHCIREKRELDREALDAYEDEILGKLGLHRTKPKDKFYYEVKREEVK